MGRQDLAARVDDLLPQTQCGQCDYAGCRPYADAIAAGEAEINQCPPGGQRTIAALAELLGRDPLPLNPDHGVEERQPTVVWIDESQCIGCALCIKACPVDAIVGAAKRMHTVIESECTGCDLCIPPCPVDCIHVRVTADTMPPPDKALERAHHARRRYRNRQQRLTRLQHEREQRRADKKAAIAPIPDAATARGKDERQAVIQAAIARTRARRARLRGGDSD
ncbi:electron transport complex protein RnfB [Natronocella acetinitrilica]|uniref:Electron transport complex protein RnfB n=1 Tax=Natronocella acetinitrilica TaxID=414046 RepID=A0AAE3G0U5_9GAMM|nr:electron transport complex protein RnfB [Natronocella acetinitrilica]